MNFSTKFFFIFYLLVISTACLFAQQGQIHGVVTDATTGDILIGANVTLKGSSLGASTDGYGSYTISGVPQGTYTMLVRYIGYRGKEMPVEVTGGSKVEMNFSLTGEAIEGQEVIVTAQSRGQRSAINQQLSSNTITNVVSAEKIHELPDDNAATALSRLPGLSLMGANGDKVVIRGIQAKMNVVLVNGVQLPSTDMVDRSTNLGFISSNLLSSIEVTKVVTPDMDANSIGGVINLKLREAPENFHFDVMAQGSYNRQDRTTPIQDNFQTWGSVSNRILDNKLGIFIQGNARRVDGGSDYANATFQPLGPAAQAGYGKATYGMQNFSFNDEVNIITEYGGSLILDYLLPNGKLMLQNTLAFTNNNMARHQDIADLVTIRRLYTVNRDINDKQLMINTFQGENTFGDLNIDYGISHSYARKMTDLRYGDATDSPIFDFSSALAAYPNQSTEDRLALRLEDTYDFPFYKDDWQAAAVEQFVRTRTEYFTERLITAHLDLKLPVTFIGIASEFKVGAKYNFSQRDNDEELHIARATETNNNLGAADFLRSIGQDPGLKLYYRYFKDYEYTRGDYFLDGMHKMDNVLLTDFMDKYFRLSASGWSPGRHTSGSNRNDFSGNERLIAGYGMGTFNFGQRWTLIAGARFEHYNSDFNGRFVFVSHAVDGDAKIFDTLNNSDRSRDDWFPNVQLRCKAADWFDVRLAFSKTLSRPDYLAMLPSTWIQDASVGQLGNPALRPAVSKNYDLYLSFYNNKIGLFTVGGFYKEIDDVFFQTVRLLRALPKDIPYPDSAAFAKMGIARQNTSARITTYMNNPDPAYLRGYELEWQTSFWYLPKPLNLLVLNVNYTRVYSNMEYDQIVIRSRYTPPPIVTEIQYEVDTSRSARLLNQADHVLNIALGADYKGLSVRVSFRLLGDVITAVGTRPEEDTFTGDLYSWDFTIKQQVLERVGVFLNGMNIGHSPQEDYRRFRRVANGPVLENLSRISYAPTRYEIGIRYTY